MRETQERLDTVGVGRGLGYFEGSKKTADISSNLPGMEYYDDCIQTGD